MIPTVTQVIKSTGPNARAEFEFYHDGKLWYSCLWVDDSSHSQAFRFPIPIDDTGNAYFTASDRPIMLMRWIRKEIDRQKSEAEANAKAKAEWMIEQG